MLFRCSQQQTESLLLKTPEHPVVSQSGSTLSYVTTRNDPEYKDGYRPPNTHVVKDIAAGEEARSILAAFIAFVNSEYSMGVNDFNIEGPDYLNTGAPVEEPAPTEPTEPTEPTT